MTYKRILTIQDISCIGQCSLTVALPIVDPAMADNGKLYPGFDAEFVEGMKTLAFSSDIILPNITEACLLTGTEYQENYDEAYITNLLDKLSDLGAKTIILTGVSFREGETGVAVQDNGTRSYFEHERIEKGCHGTGDVYASAFVGAYLQGKSAYEAASIAARYTLLCIKTTQDDTAHWYGVKFEVVLPDYIRLLQS